MKPGGGGKPAAGRLLDMINEAFGSFEGFRKEFANAANTAFGSGWAWLVQTPNGLKVLFTWLLLVRFSGLSVHHGRCI